MPPHTPGAARAPALELPPLRPGTSIRVDAGLLDTLMDLAGELVLVRGRLAELTAGESGGELVDTYRHLRRSTGELLESVRRARLEPLGTVMRRVPRIARDLAVALDKQVAVALSGEEVGVDRTINEALGDALVHLVRNAVDHGLESAGERIAAGKPATGRITIAAAQEGGRVRIEIADDGRGIDGERLAQRARERGLIAREDAAGLDAAGRRELIFLPGLSSRERAGAVSGRGVGMDAVRAHLARVGGTIEILSAPDAPGTTLRIDLPLTLAIISCVVVRSAGQRYCIPQSAVGEVISLAPGEATSIGGARLHRTREGLIPLVDLAEAFAVPRDPLSAAGARAPGTTSDPAAEAEAITAVIVESQGRRLGLIVDGVGDPIEAVVKPLPPSVRGARVFSGVTILADGRPTLVLDLDGLAGHVGVSRSAAEPAAEPEVPAGTERVELLLARGREGRRVGVPVTRVWRVERVGRERLAQGSGLEMLDYEDSLLPLVRLDAAAETDLEVIVCVCASGQVGIVVDAVEDVAEADLIVAASDGRAGLARLDAEGGVAEVLDIDAYAPTAALTR